ncbi:hypothetical protein ILUMI_19500 [Ignelater luminosus]|uniref:E3 ubiquitin-protein ligase n=1 Tax=Ignelater luminosus TaxID=2038154 RepID=A0A8K0CG41_IGNLU|nr:hypothetical protein ILUMI_19500 [Ignelater luminosus]
MSSPIEDPTNCKNCLDHLCPPIMQCEKGDIICGDCFKYCEAKKCPVCLSPLMETRNYQLEELIAKLKNFTIKASCKFADRGCKYELKLDEKDSHELECKSRLYECEGNKYCGWQCKWTGGYKDILQHFKNAHEDNCQMEFKTDFCMNVSLTKNMLDIQIIDFNDGQHLFYYKHKTDIKKKKAYWLFQYVGLKKQATQYYYEFEIHDGTRKIKITEICESDCEDAGIIFSSGRCVALPFKTIRNFLNEDEQLPIRFRIMKIKRDSLK